MTIESIDKALAAYESNSIPHFGDGFPSLSEEDNRVLLALTELTHTEVSDNKLGLGWKADFDAIVGKVTAFCAARRYTAETFWDWHEKQDFSNEH